MEQIVQMFIIVTWLISILSSILFMILALLSEDNENIELSFWFLFLSILTGYLTFIPFVLAFIFAHIYNRK